MPNLPEYRTRLQRLQGQRDRLKQDAQKYRAEAEKWTREALWSEEARVRMQTVAQDTQRQLEYHISEPVSLAQAAVFPDPYALKVVFDMKRGKTECSLAYVRDGREYRDVLFSVGGGAADVGAFALQVAALTLARPRPRMVLLADEPLKWLKGGDLPEKGAEMIGLVSRQVGVQVICISHIPDQIAGADRVFRFTKKGAESEVI